MEVVVGVAVFSQVGLALSDEYFRRKSLSAPPPPPNDTTSAPPSSSSITSNGNDDSNAEVRKLELELKELKEKARDANSPDTFVQYAKLTREANAVEKKLIALRGDIGLDAASLPILDLMTSMMPPGASASVASQAKRSAIRTVLGLLPLVFLWVYFRFISQKTGQESSAFIVAECDLFRPFTFLLRKLPVQQTCTADSTNTCDAASETAVEMCAIGYRAVSIVTNSVVARLIAAFKSSLAQ